MIANLRPYPKMKESGIDWLGRVPEHWELRRLGASIDDCVNGVWGADPDDRHNMVCVRVADFDRVRRRVDMSRKTIRAITQRERRRRLLNKGDLLIEMSGGGNLQPVGAVVMYDHDAPAVCSNFVARMSVAPNYDPTYLTYLHSCIYERRLNTRSIKQTTGIQNLDSYLYLSERSAFPPLSEQTAIGRFLDHTDRRLQRYVRARKQLIALLYESDNATIYQAVTGQIDVCTGRPYLAYRPSGVGWIGDIPEHWQVKKLTQVARQETGHTPSRRVESYWVPQDCVIPWVSLADVWQMRSGTVFITTTKEKVSEVGLAHSAARLLPKNTVILSRTASVGHVAILATPMATTQDFAAWICSSELRPKFLYFVLTSMKTECQRVMIGSTHQTIYMPDIRAFRAPVPSIETQDAISRFLDSTVTKTRLRVDRIQGSIDLVREYRDRLISDVVTGKLSVREASAGFPEIDVLKNEVDPDESKDANGSNGASSGRVV